jgi:hypothetical protein
MKLGNGIGKIESLRGKPRSIMFLGFNWYNFIAASCWELNPGEIKK